ncbi:hypothetical protein A2U01_0058494, partial [Trifolium medium]|nr:hypothetical protein [Trifolium medium]
MMESIEKADVKRLTLISHSRLEEEKQRLKKEKKKAEEEEERKRDAEKEEAEAMIFELSNQEGTSQNKGKDVMDSEPPAYILKMQADIESQRINHEALQQKVDKIATNQ